ncbi:hypothetical protein PybrP1_000170 [[Pythium] brassicae (nom. inval.)]|nr:hypothetical protein PybrP1_000170 [[Pythium] brassicae (nom. inval.)]
MATLPIASSPPARAFYGSDRHAALKIADDDDDDDAVTAATDDDAALTASSSSLEGSPLAGADASSRHHDELVRALGVDPSYGLSPQGVAQRQREYGLNELAAEEEEWIVLKFLGQFKDPLIMLLLASGAVSVVMGHTDDAVSICVAITIVVTVAFVQEYRSEKTLEALKELVPPRCHVVRDGATADVLAKELVPGDIVVVGVGDRVPADARLLEAVDLEVDESSLTGETLPVAKHTGAIAAPASGHHAHPIAERTNIVYMGTLVRSGRGRAVVFATGARTEFGLVFEALHAVEERKTPLQLSMDALGRHLSLFSLGVIAVIVGVGVLQGKGLLAMLQIGVSLAVAAIPEGLPICVTVTLAVGVMKMAKRHAVVKKLPAVEALGCISVVCADKTGTITTNAMEVLEVFVPFESAYAEVGGVGQRRSGRSGHNHDGEGHGVVTVCGARVTARSHPHVYHCLLTGALCNNAVVAADGSGAVVGQATEGAVLVCAQKVGVTAAVVASFARVSEVPFSSDKKWMAVCCEHPATAGAESGLGLGLDSGGGSGGGRRWHLKGMAEAIVARCDKLEDSSGRLQALTAADRERALLEAQRMAARGLRVLALAFGEHADRGMVLAGLVGISDPPRAEVAPAVLALRRSGVKTVMLTGDSRETAVAIATKVGIITPEDLEEGDGRDDVAVSGAELDAMDLLALEARVRTACVFYRTVPQHKLQIVRAFQAAGLQEGKAIFHNIKHFLRFQLSTSIAALGLVAVSTLCNLPSPLNAMQILWINIIMDGPPAQSLGVEPVDRDVMLEGPRPRDGSILTRAMGRRILTSALVIVAGTLFVFYNELDADGAVSKRDRTMSFTTFVMFDMFNALSCRSDDKSVFHIGLLSNAFFAYAVGASLVGQLLVIYFPPLQATFHTEALSLGDLVYICCIASSVLVLDEARKWVDSRKRLHESLRAAGVSKKKRSWQGKAYETV